jgi:NADPH:quinone reductase-like Zn-dependent oxidoreductase
MRAIWTTGTSGPDSLEVRATEDPEPAPGQVRIRVRAAGLCFAEVMAAQGLYPDAPKFPAVLGYEAAGVIDKVGEGVDERREGSHVIALARYGAHSDVVCVPANQAFAIPPHKDFTEAAAIPVNYVTAYHILFRAATIRPGERVLVHMAAGGLGTAALQLCRTVDGVETFGTASAAKHAALREEGCTHPIDYHTTDYVKEIRRLTNGEGVDVVLDPLGGADSRKGLKLLRPGGRLVAYGFANMASGRRRSRARVLRQVASIPLLTPVQLMNANKAVAGVHIGRLVSRMDLLAEELTEVLALWAAGTITPRIDGTYPFAKAADAHARILSRGNTGKIILTPA